MTAVLTRTRSVLHLDPLTDRTYRQADEETDVLHREVYLDIHTYQDLGEPDTITISIEPGDTLNP